MSSPGRMDHEESDLVLLWGLNPRKGRSGPGLQVICAADQQPCKRERTLDGARLFPGEVTGAKKFCVNQVKPYGHGLHWQSPESGVP